MGLKKAAGKIMTVIAVIAAATVSMASWVIWNQPQPPGELLGKKDS